MSSKSQFAKGVRVLPCSTATLRELARKIRQVLHLENTPCFPVVRILEFFQQTLEDFDFEIVEDHELPKGMFANYNPLTGFVQIKETFYKMANEGNGFARWTILHECLHHILHRNQIAALARQDNSAHRPYEDSEWQADTLACELLMPIEMIDTGMSAEEIAAKFGVSLKAARIRLEKMKR